ncbi:MAG: T9SS C-terminal target domain-containing protein [Bacteroidetes bacterium]|nr:MAG: T9SS C-terminal target domain-containing protein [Bacteroidota bacterium]TAF93714.1 MAG: T9SS C-terminal target domain-containing protein [Bacteroidota bacterium]
MKHSSKKALSIIFSLQFLSLIMCAQCPALNIFTRPDSAVNPHYPPKQNTFNWMAQKYITNTTYATPGNDSIWSPIFQPDNIIIDHLRLITDMKPQDGWELLKKQFGFNDDGTPSNPQASFCYIIMYNKYSATLRVFVARNSNAPFTNARILLKQIPKDQASGISESSLLDLSDGLIPLDVPFVAQKKFISPSAFDNNPNKWFFADFPMQYDPCTCYYTSRLDIKVELITSAAINLDGASTGTIAAISSSQNQLNQSTNTFSFGDLQNGAKKASEIYKSIGAFKDKQFDAINAAHQGTNTNATKNDALTKLTQFQQLLKNNNFLKAGLQAAPFIGAAASLLDFFIGGGKKQTGPQEVQLTPMAINFTTKLNGTMTTDYNFGSQLFWNPGSQISTQFNDYPYYNEIMGIFNLFETPEMKYWRGPRQRFSSDPGDWEQIYEFRLTKPIKYVLNPAARLEIQDAQMAFVIETGASEPDDNNPLKGNWVYEGKNATTGLYQYRTPYTTISSLNNTSNTLTVSGEPFSGDFWQFPEGDVQVKFLLNLKRTMDTAGAQNVLLILKYPAKLLLSSSKLSTQPAPTGSLFVHASGTEINTYCHSTTYKTNRVASRGGSTSSNSSVPLNTPLFSVVEGFTVAPNPAMKETSVTLKFAKPVILNIYLTNSMGTKVLVQQSAKQFNTGTSTEKIDVSRLNAGIYFVVVENGRNRMVKKLVVQ